MQHKVAIVCVWIILYIFLMIKIIIYSIQKMFFRMALSNTYVKIHITSVARVLGSPNYMIANMKYFELLILWFLILVTSGTYFNCIMFMVASSVVTTIMILNYHHRLADTHEMPSWVSDKWMEQSCPLEKWWGRREIRDKSPAWVE